MGDKQRIPLAEAERLALEVADLLRPACVRLEIAGSARRRTETCGDIEICAVPRLQSVADLFGEATGGTAWNELDALCDALRDGGVLADRLDVNGRRAWGSAMKRATYRGFALDIFACADPEQWGATFAIRTGGALFSHALVTPTNVSIRDAATGREARGLCPPYLQFKDWRVRHRAAGEVYPTPEETDLFALLKLPYVEPQHRDSFALSGVTA